MIIYIDGLVKPVHKRKTVFYKKGGDIVYHFLQMLIWVKTAFCKVYSLCYDGVLFFGSLENLLFQKANLVMDFPDGKID